MIELKNVSYLYPSPISRVLSLNDISVSIPLRKATAIIGRTGSGKSTLAEILSGITEPISGTVTLCGKPIKDCRRNIGIVFQQPTFFEETVYDEIAYVPKKLKLSSEELDKRIKHAVHTTGLKNELLKLSPFALSGGEQKLTAIASVLTANPDILILDEPAAGLDPIGRKCIFSLIRNFINKNKTVIFITHSMEEAAEYADNIILLDNGTVISDGTPHEIFCDTKKIKSCGLDVPQMVKLGTELQSLGIDIGCILTVDAAYNAITELLKRGNSNAS